MDLNKKKPIEYADMAYKEAVSKLKCLLAESYTSNSMIRKPLDAKDIYQIANIKIIEPQLEIAKKSLITDNSHKNIDLQALSPQLNLFIEQQEKYIQQLEQESQFCRNQLTNVLQKIKETSRDAHKYTVDNPEQKSSQQVKQLLDNIISHWDVVNKSQLEGRKLGELIELRRELSQKQALINNLKIEFQSKISNLQSGLTQALTKKDIAEQELLTTKLMAEQTDRQRFQEQSKLQIEVNSYKQRLERADSELAHCRRENLKLSEQIALLEKKISNNKNVSQDNFSTQSLPRLESRKSLTSMIENPEIEHEKVKMRDMIKTDKRISTSSKKRIVKVDLKLKVVPKEKC